MHLAIEEIDCQTYESLIKELAVCLSGQSTRDRAAKESELIKAPR